MTSAKRDIHLASLFRRYVKYQLLIITFAPLCQYSFRFKSHSPFSLT